MSFHQAIFDERFLSMFRPELGISSEALASPQRVLDLAKADSTDTCYQFFIANRLLKTSEFLAGLFSDVEINEEIRKSCRIIFGKRQFRKANKRT